jgi:hypothetical protein
MAKTNIPITTGIWREGQMASKTSYYVSVNYNGAVMAYGVRIKNAFQQRLAEGAIQFHTATQVSVKGIVSLDNYQGADMFSGKIRYGLGYDFRCLSVGRSPLNLFSDYSQDGKALKESPEIFLKYDNEDEKEDRKKSLQDDCCKV